MSIIYAAKTVEGSTEQMIFKLLADGSPVTLTGKTITLTLTTSDGTVVDTAGNLNVVDADLGKIGYTPDPTDFNADFSPYRARFRVAQGTTVWYHPNAETPALIYVAPVT